MLHRLGQLLGKHCPFQRDARGFILIAVKTGFAHHCPQHHFGMRREIAVDRNAVCRLSQMHPIGFDRQRALAFLQKRMSDVTSVPAFALNAVFGSRIAPNSSARSAMYRRTAGFCLSIVPLEVM